MTDKILYLGKEYKLEIGNYSAIKIYEDKLLFPRAAQFRLAKELHTWYVAQARKIITEQVEYYSGQMKVIYTDLLFSETRSQWGRCTHENKLQFNWKLVMASLLTINYVVVHELAHIREKNHSRAFWSVVRLYNPSYRQQIRWLKDHGQSLIN
jgi:predicted metal-dependent hydrolase